MAVISLENKNAVITGASRGIGAAIARLLAAEGVNMLLTARTASALDTVAAELRDQGAAVYTFSADMTDAETPRRLMEAAGTHFDRLDILINNAGSANNTPFEETSLKQWEYMMNINARAPFLLCQKALPLLRKSEIPFILNISSVVGRKGYAQQAVYSASKHALMGFTKALAREMRNEQIRVAALSPGGVATDLIKEMRPDLDPSHLITPEEVAESAVFLLRFRGNGSIDEIHLRRANGTPWD